MSLNSYVLRVYSMFHTIGPKKTSWEFPSDTLQLLIWLFFTAERLKINLKPRNMKNQKKKTPNVLKEMSVYQQTLQFSRRFPRLGNGFCLDDSSLNLLLSIRFVKSSTSKHQHRKTDCFAEKRLRTFACCWWCSCSPYVIRKMWAWHTTAFHKRDHEACTRDALYTKIIYPLTWLKKKRVSESSRIYPGFKIKTEPSVCWSFFESYFWKLKDFRSRPISWNAASKQQSSINDVKKLLCFWNSILSF